MERSAWLMTLVRCRAHRPIREAREYDADNGRGRDDAGGDGGHGAESRWDGADDLPVNPLACGEGAAPAAAAKPYDGGAADQVRPT